ncbi:aldo/keto reductase [uncultured Marivita sp.]|uniref:aldo/keto reductase n=1 Tax=uncultured Marivita sp. TaxID=888080 RepID=UPI00262594F7|nr:aldo/keto reductase [uncultured Marivita sp.]
MPNTTNKTGTPATLPTSVLGRNGPNVSRLALGTMTFGAETEEAEAHRQLGMFVAKGGTMIDTADVYSAGVSEEMIGRWGKNRGGLNDLVIATKGRFAPPLGSNGASRRALVRSVDASLRRLQVEAIDLYYVHGWDRYTDVTETLATLSDLVKAGKLHHTGWSNITGWQLQSIVSTARSQGLPVPVALQPQYNLLDRGIEIEVLPCALENSIGVTPWSPLAGGWLTGKYSADVFPSGATRLGEDPGRGVEAYDLRNTARTHAVLDALRAIAQRHDRPMAHIAIAWLLSRPGVASVLLGARTAEQLDANLATADFQLNCADLAALTKVSAPGLPSYPYKFVQDWSEMDTWWTLGT